MKLFKFLALAAMSLGIVACGSKPAPAPGPVGPEFPNSEVVSFFEEQGLNVKVADYALSNIQGSYEIDTSVEGYFDIYVNGTTSEELVAYKNAMKEFGWSVVSADEETSEDFKMQYGETDAYVDLLDYTSYAEEGELPYNLLSFYVSSPAMYDAEMVAAAFNEAISPYGLSATYYELETFTGWWLGAYFSESTDDSETNLQSAAYTLASFLPDYILLYTEEYVAATAESDAEYDMMMVSSDFSVGIEIYGYLDSGYLSAEIYIYDIAA